MVLDIRFRRRRESLPVSLFSQLKRLYRSDRFMIEDFHTEIVAQVLRDSHELTLSWLRRVGATELRCADLIEITTQETFSRLEGHSVDSRPDLVIRLFTGGAMELIFVESKVPSTQGLDQLQRYSEHLAAAGGTETVIRTTLVFITRDYEAPPEALRNDSRLCATRWFEFYNLLKECQNKDSLARELKLFMEENRMSLGNQFRSVDLVALENFIAAKALMDETLDGVVSKTASEVLGRVSFSKMLEELADDPRYVIHHGNWKGDIDVLIGYWLPHNDPNAPVWIGLTIYSNPKSPHRSEIIAGFKKLSEAAPGWRCEGVETQGGWATLYRGAAINTLMADDDHVQSIKNHFLALLQDVAGFLKTALVRSSSGGAGATEEDSGFAEVFPATETDTLR